MNVLVKGHTGKLMLLKQEIYYFQEDGKIFRYHNMLYQIKSLYFLGSGNRDLKLSEYYALVVTVIVRLEI